MTCRYCKKELPAGAVWCCWCGERLKKERKAEIKIPEPRLLPSGRWNIILRQDGKTIKSITHDTAEECRAEVRAIRMGLIEAAKQPNRITLGTAIDKYITERSSVVSPSTIRGYRIIQRSHFAAIMDKPIADVLSWQAAVNADAKIYSPKTVRNAWGLIAAALKSSGYPVPTVTLPQIIKNERPFLEPDEIKNFISVIVDTPLAVPALLALSSLRRSEICAARWENLSPDEILVRGAAVYDENNNVVYKDTNKNATSRRDIPIFIPELSDLIMQNSGRSGLVYAYKPNTLQQQVDRICRENNILAVGLHGLRHSFASLAYSLGLSEKFTMQIGGWSDYNTVHNIYTHLAKKDMASGIKQLSEFYSE